jgi:arabinogalactan oligomer/maltooligosaccharide transport system substrate-binding protein
VGYAVKKVLSLLLVFVLVFTMAACSSADKEAAQPAPETPKSEEPAEELKSEEPAAEEPAAEEPQLEKDATLIVWDSGGDEAKWTQFVAEEFTKKFNIPVTIEEVGHTDAPGKLKTDGPAGLGGDVFSAPHDHAGSMAASGLILENFWPDEYNKEFMQAATMGTTVDGVLYGYPTAIETYALFYNKDLVKQVPATMEELIAQSKEFTNKAENKYGFMMDVANFYFAYAFIGGHGGYVFGNNNTDANDLGLNNEGAVKAGELMLRLKKEILPLKVEDITYDVKQSLFNEGKLLFNVDGPWAVKGHRDAGVNFGVAPLPKLENGKVPTSFSGIKGFYVNAYTKYPEAASAYAKFATSEEMLLKRFEMTGQLPPRTVLLENEQVKNDEIAAAFLTQASYAVPMPNIPQMPAVWAPMGAALAAIWNEQAAPKAALDAAVLQIRDAMKLQKK